jgi:hypothetical protein
LSFYVHLRDVFTTHNGAQHLIVAPSSDDHYDDLHVFVA